MKQIADWLESHFVTPAYSGLLLAGLATCFFGAATNTMAGWLYVISGIIFALLAIAAILPERSLRRLKITRRPIEPVSVGGNLLIELLLENPTSEAKTLLEVQDLLPFRLGKPARIAVEVIAPQSSYRWTYTQPTERRGIYHWHTIQIRTAAPVGLFWCRREQTVKAKAIVYPTVLPLTHCPLIDQLGEEEHRQFMSSTFAKAATEGLTRALRPYRWGDSTRLIHWRTSARYGELRVRELEVFTGGQEVIICLDSGTTWQPESFEQAVVAAASLYFYATRQNSHVRLWTAGTGVVWGDRPVLETLAATQASEDSQAEVPLAVLVWLTCNPTSLSELPEGSRWMLWSNPELKQSTHLEGAQAFNPGLVVHPNQALEQVLQATP